MHTSELLKLLKLPTLVMAAFLIWLSAESIARVVTNLLIFAVGIVYSYIFFELKRIRKNTLYKILLEDTKREKVKKNG